MFHLTEYWHGVEVCPHLDMPRAEHVSPLGPALLLYHHPGWLPLEHLQSDDQHQQGQRLARQAHTKHHQVASLHSLDYDMIMIKSVWKAWKMHAFM